MSQPGAARRADDAAGRRPRDHRLDAGLGLRAPRPAPGRARPRSTTRSTPTTRTPTSPRRSTRRSGAARCCRTSRRGWSASRSRSAAGATRPGVVPGAERLPRPPRPRHLSRPLRVPARALPRRVARHLHLDPVRRRPAALPGGELRDARDEARAARRARRDELRAVGRAARAAQRRNITITPGRGGLASAAARPAGSGRRAEDRRAWSRWRLDDRGVSAGIMTRPLAAASPRADPHPASVIGWTTAGCGALSRSVDRLPDPARSSAATSCPAGADQRPAGRRLPGRRRLVLTRHFGRH